MGEKRGTDRVSRTDPLFKLRQCGDTLNPILAPAVLPPHVQRRVVLSFFF
jgi:hypothetical protein